MSNVDGGVVSLSNLKINNSTILTDIWLRYKETKSTKLFIRNCFCCFGSKTLVNSIPTSFCIQYRLRLFI